jgi:ssDNA-binding replication factor A large subunit
MNRAIVRLDEGTVNYIVGQFIYNNLPEELINDDKFRMEVMRYKNKDVRIVVKASNVATIHAMIGNIEATANEHNHE